MHAVVIQVNKVSLGLAFLTCTQLHDTVYHQYPHNHNKGHGYKGRFINHTKRFQAFTET